MKQVFNKMTEFSVAYPKRALAIIMLAILVLLPNAMFINFDNSQDAFFPDNETVRLLNEIEDEFQASIDFIRFIDHIDQGDLKENSTWEKLAVLEAIMLEDPNLEKYQYPLFGVQANSGMASTAMQWQRYQDPVTASQWVGKLNADIGAVLAANNTTRQGALDNLTSSGQMIPVPSQISAGELRNWSADNPEEWLARIDAKQNLSSDVSVMIGQLNSLQQGEFAGEITPVSGPVIQKLGAIMGMQSIDYRAMLIANLPAEDAQDPWNSDGPVLTTFVVVTDPVEHDLEVLDEVQDEITKWAEDLNEKANDETKDSDISVFSFSQLSTGQNANLGKELGILNSLCLLLLGFILWTKFRSLRDTAYVLILTVFAILATYGTAGLITVLGGAMVFNAAMNSIPILLLAIGVDYGLHVVARIREELRETEKRNPQGRATLRDFSIEARRKAIRSGTILTSAALMIAIFTDIVGFLSFRFSSQQFLVSFGTVIAIGLFFIYLLSITALPALMMMFPPKRLPLEKSVKIEIGPISRWLGSITAKPVAVIAVTVLLSIPMFYGFQQLEVGFDTRDNFDESVPVVADFLMISDEFQSSPSPLYVVLDGDIISQSGRAAYFEIMDSLNSTKGLNGLPIGIWSIMEEARGSEPELDSLLSNLDADSASWNELATWLQSEDGRNLSAANLNDKGTRTIISFQAATLDWKATVDFQETLTSALDTIAEQGGNEYNIRLSGRSLILAQITEDVADSAILSTVTVAGVILVMLIGINTVRKNDLLQGVTRGFVTWVPLMVVVVWVYGIMGLTGYQLNSQSVTIGALTLGLGVDYAVHLTTRMEEEAEHSPNGDSVEWTTISVATTGRAMFGAALTTAGGFSVLNFSSLVPLQLFGQVFVVAITLALISSLFVLPALYAPFLRKDAQKILAANATTESE